MIKYVGEMTPCVVILIVIILKIRSLEIFQGREERRKWIN